MAIGDWYKVKVFRKSAAFTVNLNETFDIRTKTGLKNWNNPKMLYGYKSLIANGNKFNSKITLTGGYPSYKFTSDSLMSNSSVINVLAFEGDGEGENHTDSKDTWAKMKSFGKNKVVELNESNSFTVDLKAYSNGKAWENLFIGVSIKEANLPPYFKQFDYTVSDLGNSVFKVNPRLFGGIPREILSQVTSSTTSRNISVPNKSGRIHVYVGGYAGENTTVYVKSGSTVLASKYMSKGSRLLDLNIIPTTDFSGTISLSSSNGKYYFWNCGVVAYEKKQVANTGLKLYALFLEVN